MVTGVIKPRRIPGDGDRDKLALAPSAALGGTSPLGETFQALGGVPWVLVGYAVFRVGVRRLGAGATGAVGAVCGGTSLRVRRLISRAKSGPQAPIALDCKNCLVPPFLERLTYPRARIIEARIGLDILRSHKACYAMEPTSTGEEGIGCR